MIIWRITLALVRLSSTRARKDVAHVWRLISFGLVVADKQVASCTLAAASAALLVQLDTEIACEPDSYCQYCLQSDELVALPGTASAAAETVDSFLEQRAVPSWQRQRFGPLLDRNLLCQGCH